MVSMMLLAVFGGILVASSQMVNSRLGGSIGHLKGSFWNHWVGLVFMAGLILLSPMHSLQPLTTEAPWHGYIGGLIGVTVVTLSNWIIPRLGAALTIALSVSGQMLTGVTMDLITDRIESFVLGLLGMALITLGMLLPKLLEKPN